MERFPPLTSWARKQGQQEGLEVGKASRTKAVGEGHPARHHEGPE